MNSPNSEETIFAGALRLPPDERAAYLDQTVGTDAALRQRIERLLNAYEQGGGFLEEPAAPNAGKTTLRSIPLTEKAGDKVGRYKLLQQIGEGGCGVVYMAEQEEPVLRRVALKLIKLGMDTKQVIARFEAERQALAMMDHPNIARVLDAGASDTGRPYFVMELVRGVKITEYCDHKNLSMGERLDLFTKVCQAIQHAHQKGIIHRDIKPSNILVTLHDGVPIPKVIDFGIAKATQGRLTNKTLFTAFEQFIGTPAYMSPEQAEISGLDIDTRSDIYSLGVLLYELLTGKTPFDGSEMLKAGLDEMRRTIREQEPPKPSTRLSTLSGQELSTTAQRRGLDAPKLVSELRGDLDWIVMKALEKDRARRYETANGLAMDIQRHLSNEPVVACPPSRLYRFQKTVRRNKLAFAAGTAVAASLVVGMTLSTVLFFRERAARKHASELMGTATAVNQFLLQDMLSQADSYGQAHSGYKPDPNLTVREALERAANRIGDRFKKHPLEEAEVLHTIGNTLRGLGEPERAIPHLERSRELFRTVVGTNHHFTLGSMRSLANAYEEVGELDQALPLYEETLRLMKAKLGPEKRETLAVMHDLAMAYETAGKLDQALPLYEEALKLHKAVVGPEKRDTLNMMNSVAVAYESAGKRDQAIALYEEALKLMKAKLRPDDPLTQNPMMNLTRIYLAAGKLDQALPLAEEALSLGKTTLGPDHPDRLSAMGNLAETYRAAGKLDLALPLYEELLKLRKAKLGMDHTNTLAVMCNLAIAYNAAGKLDQALPLSEETLKLRKARLGAEHRDTLNSMNNLAETYRTAGKLDQARPLHEETLKLRKAKLGPDDRDTLGSMHNLALAYATERKFDQALALREELFRLKKTKLGPDDPDTLDSMNSLAAAYQATGEHDQALLLFDETLKLRKAKLGLDHQDTLWSMLNLALACKHAGKLDKALALFRAGAEKDHAEALNGLAWFLATCSDSAMRDGRSAVAFAERAVAKEERKKWESLDTLAAAYAEAGEFAKAASVQREVIGLSKDEKVKNDLTARLKLYESNTPFRE